MLRRLAAGSFVVPGPAMIEALRNPRCSLTPAEMAAAFAVDATGPVSHEMWRPLVERLRRAAGGKAPVPRARASHSDHGKIA